jgi:hypothetical protein
MEDLIKILNGREENPENMEKARRLLAVFPRGTASAAADSGSPVVTLRSLVEAKLGSSFPGFGKAFFRFAEQISAAVAYCHEKGIVHSDIKVRRWLIFHFHFFSSFFNSSSHSLSFFYLSC